VGTCDNVKIHIKVNRSKLYMDKILTHVIDDDDCEDPNTRLRDMGMTQFMERPFHQSGVFSGAFEGEAIKLPTPRLLAIST
jgi:hypothetical protein